MFNPSEGQRRESRAEALMAQSRVEAFVTVCQKLIARI